MWYVCCDVWTNRSIDRWGYVMTFNWCRNARGCHHCPHGRIVQSERTSIDRKQYKKAAMNLDGEEKAKKKKKYSHRFQYRTHILAPRKWRQQNKAGEKKIIIKRTKSYRRTHLTNESQHAGNNKLVGGYVLSARARAIAHSLSMHLNHQRMCAIAARCPLSDEHRRQTALHPSRCGSRRSNTGPQADFSFRIRIKKWTD